MSERAIQRILDAIANVRVDIARLQEQVADVPKRLEDHEARIRAVETRGRFSWGDVLKTSTATFGLVGALYTLMHWT